MRAATSFRVRCLLRASRNTITSLCRTVRGNKVGAVIASIAVTTDNVHGKTLRQLNMRIGYCLNSLHATAVTTRGNVAHARTNVHLTIRRRPSTFFMFNGTPATLVRLYSLVHGNGTRPTNVITTPMNFIRIRRSGRVIGPFARVPGVVMRKHGKNDGLTTALIGSILYCGSTRRLHPNESIWIGESVPWRCLLQPVALLIVPPCVA